MAHVYGFTCKGANGRWSGLQSGTTRSMVISALRATGAEPTLVTSFLSLAEQDAWKIASATGPISAERAREILSRAGKQNP